VGAIAGAKDVNKQEPNNNHPTWKSYEFKVQIYKSSKYPVHQISELSTPNKSSTLPIATIFRIAVSNPPKR